MRSLLVLWATGRCNLRCRYCYAAGVSQEDMNFKTAKQAIDLMGEWPLTIQFAGGEPLLNVGLVEAVCEYAATRLRDVRFAIQTNGTLIDKKAVQLLKRFRIAVGVSLDGRPEVNDYLRGNSLETARGIKLLAEHGLATNLNAVVSDFNVGSLTGLVDMALYFGNIHGIGLDLLRKSGRAAAKPTAAEQGQQQPVGTGPATEAALRDALRLLYRYLRKVNSALNFALSHKIRVREFERARAAMNQAAALAASVPSAALAIAAAAPAAPTTAAVAAAPAAPTFLPAPAPEAILPSPSGQMLSRNYCYAALARSFVVLPNGGCCPCGSLALDENYQMGNVHSSVQPLALSCQCPKACVSCRYRAICPGGCPSRGLLNGGFDMLDCVMRKTAYQLIEKEKQEEQV
ncbi:MAG: radical SAM protein [Actinomycetia bacterium]|nr:radical SAM protein [Actinomycetes bacterium]